MIRLAIIGSGDLGQQVAHHAHTTGLFSVVGFFDDFQKEGTVRHGLPVLGKSEDAITLFQAGVYDKVMLAIGYKHLDQRGLIFRELKGKIPFASIIHQSCIVDSSCTLGEGIFMYPGCVLDMNVVIGDNALLNTGCVVAHDSEIGENCFLGPAVSIAGFVKIESSVNLGIGTVVIDNVKIATGIKTGGGAVVINNLEIPGLYVGVPAKFKKNHNE